MGKPQKKRGAAFLRELKLTAGSRRPVDVCKLTVGREFAELKAAGQSNNSAASTIAANFDISEKTARDIWKEHDIYLGIEEKIRAENNE
jgi:hypothetical protein